MALRYFVNGDGTGNWGSTANWALTSGGAGGQSVPVFGDTVFLDVNSPNCTVNATARQCSGLDCTGYSGKTLTANFNLTVFGTAVFGAGMTLSIAAGAVLQTQGNTTLGSGATTSGAGILLLAATCTLTTNGVRVDCGLQIGATGSPITVTLADNLTTSGRLTFGQGAGHNVTLNGFTAFVGGSLRFNITNALVLGTTPLVLTGTGTVDAPVGAGGGFSVALTINTSGTITFSGDVFLGNNGSLTYTAGTVVTTGSKLRVTGTYTWNCAAITWDDVTLERIGGPTTWTLTGNLSMSGTLEMSTSIHSVTLTGSVITAAGLYFNGTVSTISGTTTITLTGTGTWRHGPSATTGGFRNSITINTAGTLTILGTVTYGSGTLTYTAGTLNARGSVLVMAGATTLTTNAPGAAWGTFLVASGSNVTFNGSHGWGAEGLIVRQTATMSVLFQSGCTYTVLTCLLLGYQNATLNVASSTPGSPAYLIVRGVQMAFWANVTDIDSSGGRACLGLPGVTLTRTANWTVANDLRVPRLGFPVHAPTAWRD